MKSYRVRTVSVSKVYIIFILLLTISVLGTVGLQKLGFLTDSIVLGVFFLPMMIFSMYFFYNWNGKYKDYKVGKDGICANGEVVIWENIDSYYFFDDDVIARDWGGFRAFKTLGIKLKSGKEVTISHRTKYDGKDDFIDLTSEIERQIFRFNKMHKEDMILKRDTYPYLLRKKIGYVGVGIGVVIVVVILLDRIE